MNGKKAGNGYGLTMGACAVSYVVQAVGSTFFPMLFVPFQTFYGVGLQELSFLIAANFAVQLLMDALSGALSSRVNRRVAFAAAHFLASAGLVLLAVLPSLLPTPFGGITAGVLVFAAGGGLIEVFASPIVESCPSDKKTGRMSLLHSCYSWGCVAVVLLATAFFSLAGIEKWQTLSLAIAVLPLANGISVLFVPMPVSNETKEKRPPLRPLVKETPLVFFLILMFLAGACEITVAEWASTYAETVLGTAKTTGDLIGTLGFALTMGVARTTFGIFGNRINTVSAMRGTAVVCVAGYLTVGLARVPWLGFCGLGLVGLSVGILWPATLSLASKAFSGGGTFLFSLLALAGDVGCVAGPALAGLIGSVTHSLQTGLLTLTVLPLLLSALLFVRSTKNDTVF